MTMTTLDRPDRCAAHQEDAPYRTCRSCVEAARAAGITPAPRPDRAARPSPADCSICDDDGRLPNGMPCHHDARRYNAAELAIADIRAQLAARGGQR